MSQHLIFSAILFLSSCGQQVQNRRSATNVATQVEPIAEANVERSGEKVVETIPSSTITFVPGYLSTTLQLIPME